MQRELNMQRYARVEYVHAEQWSDCSKPLDCIRHMADEVVDTALVETTQPIYVVDVGPNNEAQQIRCSDWVVYLHDGTREVLSDTMFRSLFIKAEKMQELLAEQVTA